MRSISSKVLIGCLVFVSLAFNFKIFLTKYFEKIYADGVNAAMMQVYTSVLNDGKFSITLNNKDGTVSKINLVPEQEN